MFALYRSNTFKVPFIGHQKNPFPHIPAYFAFLGITIVKRLKSKFGAYTHVLRHCAIIPKQAFDIQTNVLYRITKTGVRYPCTKHTFPYQTYVRFWSLCRSSCITLTLATPRHHVTTSPLHHVKASPL